MRGKAEAFAVADFFVGITPAYAGKSAALSHQLRLGGDHPRLCGEKDLFRYKDGKPVGSPPPMRGKEHIASVSYPFCGITPAYAGKRSQFENLGNTE